MIGADGFGRRGRDDDGDSSCANARFLALEGGINNLSDQITNQNVLGAIATLNSKFDTVNSGIHAVEVQNLVNTNLINGNIKDAHAAETLQNAVNFQALQRQIADSTCDIKGQISCDGQKTRALIEANVVQALRDKLCNTNLELSQCKQDEKWLILSNKFDGFSKDVANNNVNFGTQISQITTALNSLQAKG